MFWITLMLILFILCGAGVFFLAARIKKLKIFDKLASKNNKVCLGASIALVLLLCLCLGLIFGSFTAIVIILHIILITALFDLIAFVIKKLSKKSLPAEARAVGVIVLTVAYFTYGWLCAHNVIETEYNINTDKKTGDIKVALLADSHLGVTLDGDSFSEELQNIQKQNPDILFVIGDLVDDDSSKSDMLAACEALGEFKAKYGVYYVFGNHDRGYSRSIEFSDDELKQALTSNGIKVLEDETVLIDNSFYVIGRKDRSDESRKEISELVEGLDSTKYTIVLDHQPNDYDAEQEAKVDLVLSGHTHGGHIFPAGFIGVFIGANDNAYGLEERENSSFIVTSGISGWAIPFKTGCVSEYVIINIDGE